MQNSTEQKNDGFPEGMGEEDHAAFRVSIEAAWNDTSNIIVEGMMTP